MAWEAARLRSWKWLEGNRKCQRGWQCAPFEVLKHACVASGLQSGGHSGQPYGRLLFARVAAWQASPQDSPPDSLPKFISQFPGKASAMIGPVCVGRLTHSAASLSVPGSQVQCNLGLRLDEFAEAEELARAKGVVLGYPQARFNLLTRVSGGPTPSCQ